MHAYAKTGKIYSAHTDAVGNVRAITDSLGGTGATYGYTVWGADAGTTNQAGFGDDMRARFKGALRFDDDVELYYMRNRWYEPHSGRFLSEDPIGLAAGINTYTFAGNDPINFRDPTGMEPDADDEEGEHDHSNFYCENGGVYDIDFGQCWGWDGHLHDPSDPSGMAPDWAFHTNGITQIAELIGRIMYGGTRIGHFEEDGVRITVYESQNLGTAGDYPVGGRQMGNAIWVNRWPTTDSEADRAWARLVHHEVVHVRQLRRDGDLRYIRNRFQDSVHGRYCTSAYEVEAYTSVGQTCRGR